MSFSLTVAPTGQPGFHLNDDREAHITATSIVLICLATLFVALRLGSRWIAKAGYWWDDILIVVAWLLALPPCIINIWGAKHVGLGQHVWALDHPEADISHARKGFFVFQIFFCLATAFIKLCTLAFYRRIFPVSQLRATLLIMTVVVTLFLIASTAVVISQCSPIHKYWDYGNKGTCLPLYNTLVVSGAVNTALDFIIVLLPVPLLWRLQTSTKQKILLTCIFSLASFVCGVSVIRLTLWTNTNPVDLTWNSMNIHLWSATEPVAGVICACITSIRPLFKLIYDSFNSVGPKRPRWNTLRPRKLDLGQSGLSSPYPQARSRTSASAGGKLQQWSANSPLMSDFEGVYRPIGRTVEVFSEQDPREPVGKILVEKEGRWKVRHSEIPFGVIRVKTDMRISIHDQWEYMDRLF